MNLIEVQELCKYFELGRGVISRLIRGRQILKAVDQITFSIPEGKTLGLVGESGCGKSTTSRLITLLIPATSGKVFFEGRDILSARGRAVREIRRHIQMVFQDPFASLNPRAQVADIIGRSLTIYHGLKGRRRSEEAARLLDLVGLGSEHLWRFPHELSGGQRQRVAIARALATRPKLLVADEPVSALDLSVQAQVLNLFKKLKKELGLTMLFISHDLNVVHYIADIIAVMYAGKIMEFGPVDQVFQHPLHPYTKGLIASNFALDCNKMERQHQLRGEIVLPVNPVAGCRLESRCPIRTDHCKEIEPPLQEKRPNQFAACHRVEAVASTVETTTQ
ncbi:MAG TPA: oligopeptide/dipeptide ABC transporter ATP-binding protein [Candidatus Eisenbacteria bacterium]|nr:oligopeptide/dipeptide ABC transporter ATP-binding protein [Candidatus Eisenbacteria bacterium]